MVQAFFSHVERLSSSGGYFTESAHTVVLFDYPYREVCPISGCLYQGFQPQCLTSMPATLTKTAKLVR